MHRDTRVLLVAQGVRALAYGFSTVLLGGSLAASGFSSAQVGLLLAAVVTGMAVMSIAVGTVADRAGRRRVYAALFVGLAASGLVFALTTALWALCLAALTGTLSTGVAESGPFTSLEQTMLPAGLDPRVATRVFGPYTAVAGLAGSAGALAAGGPELLRRVLPAVPVDHRLFLVFVPVGIIGCAAALSLSAIVEAPRPSARRRTVMSRSRGTIAGLSGLFALDSFAGGFVLQSFLAYWLQQRFGASLSVLGLIFFATGLLQAASYIAATRLSERIGLLNTMVFTHLPSNVLLLLLAAAPTLPVAVALLCARFALAQMDVPTRQAFLVALVEPDELTAAASYTNGARNAVRPFGPVLAGASQQIALGVPFVIGGALKCLYDVAIWGSFRTVPLRGLAAPPVDQDALTASNVHRPVDDRPITRYDVARGYVDVTGPAVQEDVR